MKKIAIISNILLLALPVYLVIQNGLPNIFQDYILCSLLLIVPFINIYYIIKTVDINQTGKILTVLKQSVGKINKLSLPATILVVSIILGGFYYFVETNKQKSIEQQQQNQAFQKSLEQNSIVKQQQNEASQRSLCASEAEQSAIDSNKIRCDRGEAACIKGENSYLVGQYQNYYNVCLQSKGLK